MISSKIIFYRLAIILLPLLACRFWMLEANVGAQLLPTVTATPIVVPFDSNRDLDLDMLLIFEELMQADEDCVLPCWWGFRPGETPIDEIIAFLNETGFDRDWRQSGLNMTLEEYLRAGEPFGLDFVDNEIRVIYDFGISFLIEDDHLRSMYVQFYGPNEFLMQIRSHIGFHDVLTQMEDLPEVFINGLSTRQYPEMDVFYPNLGIYFAYDFDMSSKSLSKTSPPCFSIEQTESVRMRLSQPDDTEFVREYEGFLNAPQFTFYSVEDIYDIDLAALRRSFFDNPESCLEDSAS